MSILVPTNTEDLKTLLEGLFPETRISGSGVALLAAQIDELVATATLSAGEDGSERTKDGGWRSDVSSQ